MEKLEDKTEGKKIIIHNLEFLKWYLEIKPEDFELEYKSEEKSKELFYLFTNCVYEDPFIFLRLILYIANTRTELYQEFIYKTVLHFIGVLVPQYLLSNLDMIIEFGYKNDVLYLLSTPNIQNRIIKYVEHKSKEDKDFKILLNGTMLDKIRNIVCKYKTKEPITLLENILDDPLFNGISVGL